MDHAENAFISLEGQDPIDTSSVPKASSMLEFVGWHPGTKKKTPISLLSMPIEVNFAGSAANARGNYYMATIVGQFMNASDGLVKVLICDNHSTHQVIRRALHGQLSEDEESIISQVPWFKDLQREDVPRHLPRFPMRIVRHAEEVVYGVPGVCSLDGFGYTYVFCSFQLVKSILLHLIGYLFFFVEWKSCPGHAVKNSGGQIQSYLRTCYYGAYWTDMSQARSNGLPPSSFSRDNPMSDKQQALLGNPWFLVSNPASNQQEVIWIDMV